MFLSTNIQSTNSPWCVDGRPDYSSEKGPQMLGGSLHPVVLKALFSSSRLSKEFYKTNFKILKDTGFSLGIHRGAHKNEEENRSDCGFSDKMSVVFKKAHDRKEEVIRRLIDINTLFDNLLGTSEEVTSLLKKVYETIDAYPHDAVEVSGEALIQLAVENGASVVNLEGDHKEEVAYVNLKKDTTLDTNGLNKSNHQAFNLDVWAVIPQAAALGVDEQFAVSASLILFQATELVLVEDKGKERLVVEINR